MSLRLVYGDQIFGFLYPFLFVVSLLAPFYIPLVYFLVAFGFFFFINILLFIDFFVLKVKASDFHLAVIVTIKSKMMNGCYKNLKWSIIGMTLMPLRLGSSAKGMSVEGFRLKC